MSEDFISLPVLINYDHTQPIGELRVLKSKLPLAPNYVFSLGYSMHPFELLCVSLQSDEQYMAYLKREEKP